MRLTFCSCTVCSNQEITFSEKTSAFSPFRRKMQSSRRMVIFLLFKIPEFPLVIITDGLLDFFLGIHKKRPILRNRFIDRFTT